MKRFPLYTLLFLPRLIYAAEAVKPKTFSDLVGVFVDLIGMLIILVFALTFIAVVWGVIKGWIIHGTEADGVQEGKNVVVVGVVALVIMVSIWGILRLLQNSIFG